VDFNADDPVDAVRQLALGIGADRAIDAVGVDAVAPEAGPAAGKTDRRRQETEVQDAAPETRPPGDVWIPGNAPTQVLDWVVQSLAKAGTLGIVGVYPEGLHSFPVGLAMNRNLTIKMGNCNHRRYIPHILDLIRSKTIEPELVLTQREPLTNVLDAYSAFDRRQPGWMKVLLAA